jgi:hypothetical protein
MSDLTPARLAELRAVAEARGKVGAGALMPMDPPTVLALLGEVERLRRALRRIERLPSVSNQYIGIARAALAPDGAEGE